MERVPTDNKHCQASAPAWGLTLLGAQTPALPNQPSSSKNRGYPSPSSRISHTGKPWLSSGLGPQLERLALQHERH